MRGYAGVRSLGWLLVLLVGLAMLVPPVAAGQPVSLEGTAMEVQLWPGGEPGYALFIVTGHIPEDAELPATVRLPFPDGSRVIWSGEILGGPVGEDPERESAVVDVPGGQALEITVESTRTVQYEAVGPALTVVDGMTTTVFDWVQSVPVGEVSFSVRLPSTAEEVRLDPEAPGPPRVNEAGEKLYTLRPVTLAEGQEFTVTAAYGRAGAGTEGSSGGPGVLPILLGLLGIAVVALVIVLFAQRRRAE